MVGTKALIFLVLSPALGALAGPPASPLSTASAFATEWRTLQEGGGSACVFECHTCGSGEHEVNPSIAVTHKGSEHSCGDTNFTCETGHTCQVTSSGQSVDPRSLLRSLERYVAQGDVESLRSLLHSGGVRLVRERHAVQIVSTCESVLAQVPIPAAIATELGEN